MKKFTLIIFLACSYAIAVSQSTDTLEAYTTKWVQGEPPRIDGHLDDAAWDQVEWGGGQFRQSNPNPGKAASVIT